MVAGGLSCRSAKCLEGLTEGEILRLLQAQMEKLILLGEPLVFRVGSALSTH